MPQTDLYLNVANHFQIMGRTCDQKELVTGKRDPSLDLVTRLSYRADRRKFVGPVLAEELGENEGSAVC